MTSLAARLGLQRHLGETSALMEAVLDSVGDGVLGVDRAGFITFANSKAARVLGHEAGGLAGLSTHEFLCNEVEGRGACSDASCPVRMSLSRGIPRLDTLGAFRRKDGSRLAVMYRVTPIRCEGAITGAIVGFTDLTERNRIEAEFLRARKLEGIGRLAAGVAHEINTPTQYVNDNVHFLSDSFKAVSAVLQMSKQIATRAGSGQSVDKDIGVLAAKMAEVNLDGLHEEMGSAIDQTLEGLDRITTIVGALNEFLHPGAEEKIAVDLNHAIENAITVCRNEWRYVADIVLELSPTLPAVSCFLGEFSQVMVNIITNAAHAVAEKMTDASDTRGQITVSTRVDGEWVEVRIRDTGTGIAPEDLHKVFDSFFTTKQAGRGTGQGLAIAQSVVVEKHQGTIDVESELGTGATFIVRLPLHNRTEMAGAKNSLGKGDT